MGIGGLNTGVDFPAVGAALRHEVTLTSLAPVFGLSYVELVTALGAGKTLSDLGRERHVKLEALAQALQTASQVTSTAPVRDPARHAA